VPDVAFNEDRCCKRAGYAAQNFSLLNRIALNLLKQETTLKRRIKGKRFKAVGDHPYLLKLPGFDMPTLVGKPHARTACQPDDILTHRP